MEQYWMRKPKDLKNLKTCLDNYKPSQLYIRDCGGSNPDGSYRIQGMTKVKEGLVGKVLSFEVKKDKLVTLIDDKEVFVFNDFKKRQKGWSLAYERTEQTPEGPRTVMLGTGINPYSKFLPEPDNSILRGLIDNHLMEITFPGRVELAFDGWFFKPHWKYWKISNDKQTR